MSVPSPIQRNKVQKSPSDETAVTEIEFTADGRIYLFGASPQLLLLLRDCGLSDEYTSDRLPGNSKTTEVSAILEKISGPP